MSHRISRREVLQGAAAVLAVQTLPSMRPAGAQAALASFAPPAPSLSAAPPRGMGAVTAALRGVGVYVGNEWAEWDSVSRRFALARIRAWGFDFVCPKVGGYGRTWYESETELAGWADSARSVGLGFVPFLYTIPETAEADARLAAQMARVIGVVCVDMEDEWGSAEKGAVPGYRGGQMAAFGRIYRQEAGERPIIVTGYGDPITRFGPADTGFPHTEMAAWADAYSPQWYIGVYSRYKKGGVQAALDWGRSECRQALGADFPICPSVDLNCSFTPDHLLPLADTRRLMESLRSGDTPIFVWEYGEITPAHAETLLGQPQIRSVRVGRSRFDSLSVVWNTSVPARSVLSSPASSAKPLGEGGPLELTHSGSLSALTPGTAYPVVLYSSSGGGAAPPVPLTVATAPLNPGIFVQSVLAERRRSGHVGLTVLVANSADSPAADVTVTAITINGGSALSPLPQSLGTLGKRDWQASTRDRTALEIVAAAPAPGLSSDPMTLHISGTADGSVWSAVLPVVIPETTLQAKEMLHERNAP